MEPVELTYGTEGFKEIKQFLDNNKNLNYTLLIYNTLDMNAIKVGCNFNEILEVIMLVSNIEHDFPSWIGINEASDSYVVGIEMVRGRIITSAFYEYKDKQLIMKYSF